MCLKKKDIETKENLKHERSERDDIMKQFVVLHHKFDKMIESFNGKGNHDLKKKELESLPFGSWIALCPGVNIFRLKNLPGDMLVFETEMEKDARFGLHMHSDCEEACDVLEGSIVDAITGEEYKSGTRAFWGKGVEHIPVALYKTKLMVYFK